MSRHKVAEMSDLLSSELERRKRAESVNNLDRGGCILWPLVLNVCYRYSDIVASKEACLVLSLTQLVAPAGMSFRQM